MNAIPLDTAKAIAQSFSDALANNEFSFQKFTDIYKGDTYREFIERTCFFEYDKLNRHDISRFYIDERSIHGIFRRVYIDGVTNISIDSTGMYLVVDSDPYKFCIQIQDKTQE